MASGGSVTMTHPAVGEQWLMLSPTTLPEFVQQLEVVVCRVEFDLVHFDWVPRDLDDVLEGGGGCCWVGQLVERLN